MDASAITQNDPTAFLRPEASLGTTEVPKPMTTADLRQLTVSTGLRTVHEVLWGDALFDKYSNGQMERLMAQGATPALGNPVDVRE